MSERGVPRLVDRPWPDVGRPIVLVPVGSTEQHGPHLPLDTDTTVAAVVAAELAARLTADGIDAVVAPAIAYGASGEHQGFAGTVSIGTAGARVPGARVSAGRRARGPSGSSS